MIEIIIRSEKKNKKRSYRYTTAISMALNVDDKRLKLDFKLYYNLRFRVHFEWIGGGVAKGI